MADPNVAELRPQFDALHYAADFIGFRKSSRFVNTIHLGAIEISESRNSPVRGSEPLAERIE
jgi:hypothetical protein